MNVKGSHTVAVERTVVWEALLDPDVLSRTLPGCEDLAPVGDNNFRGKLKMKVGPVQGVFQGGVELFDLDPPNGYRLKMDGRGAPGFVNGSGSMRLEATDDGGTTVHYELEAQVGGRLAAVGQRLLDSSAKVLTRQGLQSLEKQLEARTAAAAEAGEAQAEAAGAEADDADAGETDEKPAAPDAATSVTGAGPAAAAAPEAPSQTTFAAQFVIGLAREYWPWLVGGALVVLAVAAAWIRSSG